MSFLRSALTEVKAIECRSDARSVSYSSKALLGALFSFIVCAAQAQTAPAIAPVTGSATAPVVDAATELQGVTISASRSQARVEQMPLHTTIITPQEIERSPARTLDQLLRNVPGLNFTGVPSTQSDPTGHQTRMRGMGNAKVLVLLDGIPMHDPFYLTTQWFKVPMSNIERVEVVRGGNSSIWGNMAVAGVVNIVSKRARDNSGEFSMSLGSRGSYNLALSKNFAVSDALSFNFTIDQLSAKGYTIPPADQLWRFPARQPVDAKNTNLQMTTFFKPSSDLSGYFRLGLHIQDQDISYQFGNNLQRSPDLSANLIKRFDDKTSLSTSLWAQNLSFEKYNGASCYWQASGTRCPSTTNVTLAQINSQIVQYYTQYGSQRYKEQGASSIYSKDMGGLLRSVQVGLDYRKLSATDLEYFYASPTNLATTQNLSSSTYGAAEQTFTGVFAQTRLAPHRNLEITLSARYDDWNNSDRFNTRTTSAVLTTGGAQPDGSKSALNPSFAARYAVSDDLALRGAVYKSFRAPGFNNTTRTFGATSPTIANPDLAPETLTGKELGLDYVKDGFSLAATYYHYDIKDMIATFRVNNFASAPSLVKTICGAALANCGGSASFYTNDQDGASEGVELVSRWQVQPSLTLTAAYTRTSTKLTRVGNVVTDPVGVQLAGTPRNVGTFGALWKPQDRLQFYAQARYIGGMYIDTTTTTTPARVFYEQGGFTVFDASMAYRWSKTVDLTASVVNLFDKTYSENAYTFNQPWNRTLSMPRTVNLGMRVRF
jgi:outer membrane receptor protein involved in Fe transport